MNEVVKSGKKTGVAKRSGGTLPPKPLLNCGDVAPVYFKNSKGKKSPVCKGEFVFIDKNVTIVHQRRYEKRYNGALEEKPYVNYEQIWVNNGEQPFGKSELRKSKAAIPKLVALNTSTVALVLFLSITFSWFYMFLMAGVAILFLLSVFNKQYPLLPNSEDLYLTGEQGYAPEFSILKVLDKVPNVHSVTSTINRKFNSVSSGLQTKEFKKWIETFVQILELNPNLSPDIIPFVQSDAEILLKRLKASKAGEQDREAEIAKVKLKMELADIEKDSKRALELALEEIELSERTGL